MSVVVRSRTCAIYSPRDGTQTRRDNNPQAALAHGVRETRVQHVLTLVLFRARAAAVFERIIVSDLAEKRAAADDTKSDPKAPHQTADDGDNLMSAVDSGDGLTSWPNRGGKEMTNRIPIGIAQPPGVLLSVTIRVEPCNSPFHPVGCWLTPRDDLVMVHRHEDDEHNDNGESKIVV